MNLRSSTFALLLCAITLTFVASCVKAFTYHDFTAWTPAVCQTGLVQSPVDLSGYQAAASIIADKTLTGITYQARCNFADFQMQLYNRQTTLVATLVNPLSNNCWLYDPTRVNAHDKGRRFSLLEIHFHTKSEHTMLGGKNLDLEIHFVHNMSDSFGVVREYLIIAALGQSIPRPSIPSGTGEATVLDQLLSTGLLNSLSPNFTTININPAVARSTSFVDMFPSDSSYLTYQGSLTTPPCSETATWIVFNKPIQVYNDTVAAFWNFMARTDAAVNNGAVFTGNNRPTQNYGARPHARYYQAPAYVSPFGGAGAVSHIVSNVEEVAENLTKSSGIGGFVVGVVCIIVGFAVGFFSGKKQTEEDMQNAADTEAKKQEIAKQQEEMVQREREFAEQQRSEGQQEQQKAPVVVVAETH